MNSVRAMASDLRTMVPRRLARLPHAQKRALLLTLASLAFWTWWNAQREFGHPWGDISRGRFTDHISHMNAARLFPRVGLDLWRVPVGKLFRSLTDEEMARMPDDVQKGGSETGGVHYVPGWPSDKPLVIAWTDKTRMYPPGDMVLVAPIAVLYHYTSLSLESASRVLIGWYILLAHVALFFFFLAFYESRSGAIEWLAAFLVYSNVMHFTLEGFYDAVVIAPLVLCARYWTRRRGVAALLAYCVAAFLHFRAFFLAPWALVAAFTMVRTRFWQRLDWRAGLALATAGLLGAISLYTFWLDLPSLRQVPEFNPVVVGNYKQNLALIWNLKIVIAVCAVALLWSRAWLDVVMQAWLSAIIFLLREFAAWHLVIPMAWIAAPTKRNHVRAIRLAFLMTVLALVLGDWFSPSWMGRLYSLVLPGPAAAGPAL
jgi:hypothetical protein